MNLQTTENEKQDYRPLVKAARLFPPTGGAFLVGGCVRDLLTGSRPADYDLAVSGKPKPTRVKMRSPAFTALSVLSEISQGWMISDVLAILGSLDIVLGEIDR